MTRNALSERQFSQLLTVATAQSSFSFLLSPSGTKVEERESQKQHNTQVCAITDSQ